VNVRIELRVESGGTIVTVSGRLAAEVVRELHELCESVEGALVLDLSGLVSADAQGLEALRELEEKGAQLRDVSPFIRLLLGNGGARDEPPRVLRRPN
jgi:anti-anti-sigma regulatory factor